MATHKLKEFLNNQKVKYEIIKHSPAYTAHEIAQSAHIPGKILAKTIIIKNSKGQMCMVVMSAKDKINFAHLEKALAGEHCELASEREFKDKFPGCEVGAMPPFGNLYNMDVYIDDTLANDSELVFNAGSHTELIRMNFQDYNRLVHPRVLHAV